MSLPPHTIKFSMLLANITLGCNVSLDLVKVIIFRFLSGLGRVCGRISLVRFLSCILWLVIDCFLLLQQQLYLFPKSIRRGLTQSKLVLGLFVRMTTMIQDVKGRQ